MLVKVILVFEHEGFRSQLYAQHTRSLTRGQGNPFVAEFALQDTSTLRQDLLRESRGLPVPLEQSAKMRLLGHLRFDCDMIAQKRCEVKMWGECGSSSWYGSNG